MSRWNCLVASLIAAASGGWPAAAPSAEPPPPGPPWQRELAAAQKTALEKGTPIFVYFTKKVCPHCVPVEKNTLPSPALEPAYDRLAWLYVNRNFDGSPLDRAAERIELRFGVSSYPKLLLVHPETLEVIRPVGRTPQAILAGVDRAPVRVAEPKAAAERLQKAEERAAKLVKSPTVAAAKKGLDDEDVVVRYQALQVLAARDPRAVVARAGELLRVPHDPFRYEVCEVLEKAGDRTAAAALEALARKPEGSLNPNVLRVRAVQALSRCGGETSVPVVASFATTGDANNGLTGAAVDALGAIAARAPRAKAAVKAALVESYPPPGGSGADRARREELARRVHRQLVALTGKAVPFPAVYDEPGRAKLMKGW